MIFLVEIQKRVGFYIYMYIYTIYCINYTVVASVSHEEDILDKF